MNKRHSLIPQYHQSSVQNLNKSGGGGGGCGVRGFNANTNTNNRPVKMMDESIKEFELSNLLRIKSNKLGNSAPNLCSSMVVSI